MTSTAFLASRHRVLTAARPSAREVEGDMRSGWRLMVPRLAAAVGLAMGSLSLGGCVALFRPSVRSVPVTSTPVGAEVWVDGELL